MQMEGGKFGVCAILVFSVLSLRVASVSSAPDFHHQLEGASHAQVQSTQAFYSAFRDYDAIIARLRFLSRQDLAFPPRLSVIGKSAERRDIVLARVGNPNAPRKILINGLQHAREWLAAMVVTRLVEIYADDREIRNFLQNVELLLIPVVNPDGFEYTKIDRFWRKNREFIPNSNCRGVDLNRNWPVDFNGSSAFDRRPCSETYPGLRPFSSRESAALRDLIDGEPEGSIVFHLDVHTFGALVLGPWGFTDDRAPFFRKSNAVGRKLVSLLRENAICGQQDPRCGRRYFYGTGSNPIGLASGIFPDYTYSLGIMSYTLELRPGDAFGLQGFAPNRRDIARSSRTVNAALRRIVCFAAKRPRVLLVSGGARNEAPQSLGCR